MVAGAWWKVTVYIEGWEWCIVHGGQWMVDGVWWIGYGVWCMVDGVWCMVHGG